MDALTELLTLIGLGLKVGESEIGANNAFLGLNAYFPQPPSSMLLAISPPRGKARKCASLIRRIVKEGSISHATLESTIGRLSFAQTAVFCRFARAMPKPLYSKLFSKRHIPNLSPTLVRNLEWRAETMQSP